MEKEIGQKIRELRKKRGISQMDLAERVGLSFQQIQKYEKGISKITVSRLAQIAMALDVDICIFFKKKGDKAFHIMEDEQAYTTTSLDDKEKTLLTLFRNVDNNKIKEGIILLLKGIVEKDEKDR